MRRGAAERPAPWPEGGPSGLRRRLDEIAALAGGAPAFGLSPAAPAGRRVLGRCFGTTVSSVLQPVHAADGRRLGWEALARLHSAAGGDRAPGEGFAEAGDDAALIALDRLCRTVHALNFRLAGLDGHGTLILNVHGRLLHAVRRGHGAFFSTVLAHIGLPPAAIVIDLPALPEHDVHWLRRVVASYRTAGFAVAVEAVSGAHAGLLAALARPDWVRLPPAAVEPALVARLHRLAVRVLASRVETAAQRCACIAAGVDALQGYALGRPERDFGDSGAFNSILE